jgi:hypothetical protein
VIALLLLAGDVLVDPVKGPHRTIAEGLAALKAGDVLRLAPGEYRESIVLETSGVTIEGQGAVLTGLDPLDKAAFEPRGPEVYRIKLPALAAGQPRVVLDGLTMDAESLLEEMHDGEFVWARDVLYLHLPHGKEWGKVDVRLRVRRDGVVVRNASNVTIRNLTAEHWEGDAFRVEGRAEGVRLENCEGRLAAGGESRGLHVRDAATVAATSCRFRRNTMGAHAIHRSRSVFAGCVFEENANVGARVNGAEHAFEDVVFRGNGAADLMAISLPPDSANGGGPCAVRVERALFAGGRGPGLWVSLGEHGGGAVVRDSVFSKDVALSVRGGPCEGGGNLIGGAVEVEEGDAEPDVLKASERRKGVEPRGPWSVGGREIGPRR